MAIEASDYDGETNATRWKGYLSTAQQYSARITVNDSARIAHIEADVASGVDGGSFQTVPFKIPLNTAPIVIPTVLGDNRFTIRVGSVKHDEFTMKLERGDTSRRAGGFCRQYQRGCDNSRRRQNGGNRVQPERQILHQGADR
jgi:hypothetical protein